MASSATAPFKLLFVCTGNRCRSPFAAAHFAQLAEGLPVEVLSAGTLDAPGMRVPSELVQIGGSSGLDLSSHRSHALAREGFVDIDLAIGFERQHVAEAVVNAGVAPDRAFTLREFARLLRSVDVPHGGDLATRARAVVTAAAEKRGQGPAFVPNEEMEDPYLQSMDVYRTSASEIIRLCDEVFRGLFPATD